MPTGTVKWFDARKGYGFIVPDDGTAEMFVHMNAVQRAGLDALTEGQRVEYQLVREKRRSAAVNLRIIE